ncbi:MAG: indole-3-glycerol phosphate synthase TrpC [Dehalococcoidia bacterium]|nr:indole-3-glycerol phosphate synthase TrpC [Dehalococcoidia bacterium]|tara:strand:+ start:776 stop:1576 length:801 start_codon:yes stop_codon:yes gene_type:complete
MLNILDEIIAAKRIELADSKKQMSVAELESAAADQPRPLNLSGALLGGGVRLIAEVKKASPSRGLLMPDFDHLKLAETYTANGAAAISCLTDLRFQGELSFLQQIKETGASQRAPVIRKDFIFDPYQVVETRAAGADAMLLIVAVLEPAQLKELLNAAQAHWMQCLVEVHDEAELETAVDVGAEIIGINNRDLRTFSTDLSVTERIAPLVPRGKQIVSESGIFTRDHLRQMNKVRVNAVLVGEALVTAPDVGEKVRELTGQKAPTA